MARNRLGQFAHRNVLGCWINDISCVPRRGHWPCGTLDESIERDLCRFFRLLEEAGFNSIVLFGLFVTRQWEVNYADSISREREQAVKRVIDEAHRRLSHKRRFVRQEQT